MLVMTATVTNAPISALWTSSAMTEVPSHGARPRASSQAEREAHPGAQVFRGGGNVFQLLAGRHVARRRSGEGDFFEIEPRVESDRHAARQPDARAEIAAQR